MCIKYLRVLHRGFFTEPKPFPPPTPWGKWWYKQLGQTGGCKVTFLWKKNIVKRICVWTITPTLLLIHMSKDVIFEIVLFRGRVEGEREREQVLQITCGDQSMIYRCPFTLSTSWIPGIELRTQGLVTSTFSHWTKSLIYKVTIPRILGSQYGHSASESGAW